MRQRLTIAYNNRKTPLLKPCLRLLACNDISVMASFYYNGADKIVIDLLQLLHLVELFNVKIIPILKRHYNSFITENSE